MFRAWKEIRRFRSLPEEQRALIFYAEDHGSWPHFQEIIASVVARDSFKFCYVTSSNSDPILRDPPRGVETFFIGSGVSRTYFFSTLRASVVVMTMPDLNSMYIKRSMVHPIHYVYVFHSMVSTHMIYRRGAFDHFDTLLCVGPHHTTEVRATEKHYNLRPKELVNHGYGRLDNILRKAQRKTANSEGGIRVLIAPSYGPNGLIERKGVELTKILLESQFHVTVRPHPVTIRTHAHVIFAISDLKSQFSNLAVETNVASQESLHASDLLISDWSGAALEYAFGLERPVLFIDVPRKINNPEYASIGSVPMEVTIRNEIGEVVAEESLSDIPSAVRRLCSQYGLMAEKIRACRNRYVFNLGKSGAVGADYLCELISKRTSAVSNKKVV